MKEMERDKLDNQTSKKPKTPKASIEGVKVRIQAALCGGDDLLVKEAIKAIDGIALFEVTQADVAELWLTVKTSECFITAEKLLTIIDSISELLKITVIEEKV